MIEYKPEKNTLELHKNINRVFSYFLQGYAVDRTRLSNTQVHHKDLAVHRRERTWPMFNIQWHEIRKRMTTEKRTRDELKRRWQVLLKKKLAPEPFTVKDDLKLAKAVKKLKPMSEEDLKGSWTNLGLTQSGWQVKERWHILSKKIKGHEEMSIGTQYLCRNLECS